MSKRVAILQSSYVPWRGYFDIINMVDEFILFDDVQFTRRDWRNRNRIKSPQGGFWLTIPVVNKNRYEQRIRDTEIADPSWARKHWQSIVHSYGKAPAFRSHGERIEALYEAAGRETHLSCVNHLFLEAISGLLGIATPLRWSEHYAADGRKTERLVAICSAAGATHYLSGPSAQAYIEPERFAEHGITLEYMDYSGYPSYPQLHGEFDPRVSILDLLLHQGDAAPRYLKSFAVAHGPGSAGGGRARAEVP